MVNVTASQGKASQRQPWEARELPAQTGSMLCSPEDTKPATPPGQAAVKQAAVMPGEVPAPHCLHPAASLAGEPFRSQIAKSGSLLSSACN